MYKVFLLMISGLLLIACQSQPTADNLTQAQEYYKTEQYQLAAKELLPLAKQGSPDAQYALGYLYYNGLGVPQNEKMGRDWIRLAAKQNYVPAKQALWLLTEQGG